MAKRGRPAGRGRGLAGLSYEDLQSELHRRERVVSRLTRRRDQLAARLARVEAEIDALAGASNGRRRAGPGDGGRRRPRNETNLVEALKKLLSGRTLSVTDAADAVQKAGYKTTSSTFRTIVNQTLINSGQFKRVGRGLYTSK